MPLEDIAPEIMEFVDNYIDCFVSWDILVYFHENPDMERKLSGIAMDIGRRPSSIEKNLANFVESGIIATESGESEGEEEASFRYDPPSGFRDSMDTSQSHRRMVR